VALALAGFFLALLRYCDPVDQDLDSVLMPFCRWFYHHRFEIAVYLLSTQTSMLVVKWLLEKIAPRPNIRKIERVLDRLVMLLFEDPDRATHVYRATLFKAKWFPFCGKWLGAVARSGHTYRRLMTVFSLDPEKTNNNTGFAGECWRQGGDTIMCAEPLPDQRVGPVTPESEEDYKRKGFVADEEYNKVSVMATVFLATGIKVDGQIWGILVIDSTDAKTIPTAQTKNKRRDILHLAAESLSALVTP
jgi:hypothetical protein